MTKEELHNYIKTYFEGCVDCQFIDNVLDKLDKTLLMHQTFNCQKFADWINAKGVIYKDKPLVFLVKCGFADIQRGIFDTNGGDIYTKSTLVIQELFNNMRLNGISVDTDDTAVIDYYENYIVQRGLMTVDRMIEWNNQAIGYLANNNKTSKDFIALFKNSKIMRGLNLNYEEMDKKCEQIIEEWHVLINSICSAKHTDQFK